MHMQYRSEIKGWHAKQMCSCENERLIVSNLPMRLLNGNWGHWHRQRKTMSSKRLRLLLTSIRISPATNAYITPTGVITLRYSSCRNSARRRIARTAFPSVLFFCWNSGISGVEIKFTTASNETAIKWKGKTHSSIVTDVRLAGVYTLVFGLFSLAMKSFKFFRTTMRIRW